jgi:parallel beta-helix repeat protein
MTDRKHPKIPLTILLLSTVLGSALVFLPTPVFANPACGTTVAASTTLTASVGPCPATGLVVGANNIVLNCAGFTISSSTGTGVGIRLSGRTGVTVENCKVTGFAYGFALANSAHNFFITNTATCNKKYGFFLSASSNNNLYYNTATCPTGVSPTAIGFYLLNSNSNVLISNRANGNTNGIYLSTSGSNTLIANIANSNTIDGFFLTATSHNNHLTSNTANSNRQYGYFDASTLGPGTLGTWNFYYGNMCNLNGLHGSHPLALGTPQP